MGNKHLGNAYRFCGNSASKVSESWTSSRGKEFIEGRNPRLHEVGEGFCGMRKCGPYNIDVGNADWLLKST